MNDEMPNILTQHKSGSSEEAIIRLSEPYQQMKCDILPIFNLGSEDDDINEKKNVNYQVQENSEKSFEIVKEWLNKQRHIDEEEEEEEMQYDEKIKVEEMVNLRIIFDDDDDLKDISPLQRDVLEFLFKEFN